MGESGCLEQLLFNTFIFHHNDDEDVCTVDTNDDVVDDGSSMLMSGL